MPTKTKKKMRMPTKEESKEFIAYHLAHPEIFEAFQRAANARWNAGHRHYGAKAIAEEMRFHLPLDYSDREIKIENNMTSMYSRFYIAAHPDREGFFDLKPLASERAAKLPSIKNFVNKSTDADLLTVCAWIDKELAHRGLVYPPCASAAA